MVAPPNDSARCPVCTRANDCALARGESTCWCFDVTIAPEALLAVPEELAGQVCICRGCAGVSDEQPSEARGESARRRT